MDKQGLKAVQSLPNGYDAQFIKDNAQYFEGSFVAPQFVAFEKTPQIDEQKLFLEWIKKTGKPPYELTVSGWIAANQFVKGLKLAGPEFIAAEGDRRAEHAHRLQRERDDRADRLDQAAQRSATHPETRSQYQCANELKVEGGKFVPVYDQPGKPWVCMVGGPDTPTAHDAARATATSPRSRPTDPSQRTDRGQGDVEDLLRR